MPNVSASRCVACESAGLTTRPGARFFRNPQTGEILCADHLPKGAPAAPGPPPSRGDPAIATRMLTKRYGARAAVEDLSFEVPRGGVVGFVGPNGAGKTTTIRMLMGLVRPTAGTATVLGELITTPARYLSRVGALIESPAFYPYLSGRRNLRALAVLGGSGRENVDEILAQVGLLERADSPVKAYSLGMRQRLAIGAALLSRPELLILDEPTNGLDPAGIHEVRAFLRDLGNQGKTVFVSSHLLGEIQRMCDRLVVLRAGHLVFEGTVAELEKRTQGFVATPRKAADRDRLLTLCKRMGRDARLVDPASIRVSAPASWAADFNELAFRDGIVVQELRPLVFDLEETILEMTGREANP